MRFTIFLQRNSVAFQPNLTRGLSPCEPKKAKSSALTRQGWAAAAKQAHLDGQDQLMAEDVFEDDKVEDWQW